jgi:GTP cyclohydrolase I
MEDIKMAEKLILTTNDLNCAAALVAKEIKIKIPLKKRVTYRAYAVPRGGFPAAYLLGQHLKMILVEDMSQVDFIIDDIVDTGKTRHTFWKKHKKIPFFALVDKIRDKEKRWVVFPWEGDAAGGIVDNIIRLLEFVGEDPTREGLIETPARVVKAWESWTSGYNMKPEDVLKCFEDGGEAYDQMVSVNDLPFYSHCEHHLTPIFGTATIAYIPDRKIVGLSKLSRLLDIYARRLQVQERLTDQITAALVKHLKPRGAACLIKARHLCMESRGIQKQGHYTVTSSLKGVFLEDHKAREEFMALAR